MAELNNVLENTRNQQNSLGIDEKPRDVCEETATNNQTITLSSKEEQVEQVVLLTELINELDNMMMIGNGTPKIEEKQKKQWPDFISIDC